jgi:hypothetical protein
MRREQHFYNPKHVDALNLNKSESESESKVCIKLVVFITKLTRIPALQVLSIEMR